MFNILTQAISILAGVQTVFDPVQFDDPIAQKTEWTPAKDRGANFQTHRLVEVNHKRIEFQTTLGAKLFCMVPFLFAAGMIIGFVNFVRSTDEFFLSISIIVVFLGILATTALGISLLYFNAAPTVLDKKRGLFWKGWKSPAEKLIRKDREHKYIWLQEIHALQLISELCRGKNNNRFYSYELNLVLKNGERINVVENVNQKKIQEDAERLSAFLGKPVWDAIEKTKSY